MVGINHMTEEDSVKRFRFIEPSPGRKLTTFSGPVAVTGAECRRPAGRCVRIST
jgi:hypothetical protein